MTDFTNLAALVAQGQALLDEIKGGKLAQIDASFLQKLIEVDATLAAKIAQANTDIAIATAPINERLVRLQITKNQELYIDSGTVPDDMVLDAGVVSSLVATIGTSGVRDAEQVSLLTEISADVLTQFADFDLKSDDYHITSWNIIRLVWDFGAPVEGKKGLGYIKARQAKQVNNALPFGAEYTAASLAKLESGGVQGHYLSGADLGKWRFCSESINATGFGRYTNVTLYANTQAGSLLIALPVVTTGVIDHPHKLFKNIEL